ncbi:MAG TPA: AIR synthase-related protein, partial [Acidimicrobiales bacterium]|nr:AIR synthase-related protein [Acidimicrobiales bacterium]
DGVDIDPTPVIGLLGVIDELLRRPAGAVLTAGGELLQLGASPLPAGALAGSRWAEAVHGHRGGALAVLDVSAHSALCGLVRGLVVDGVVDGVHDVADGGIGLTLAEMAVRSGVGFDVRLDGGHPNLFSEAPSRVVVCVAASKVDEVQRRAAGAGVPVIPLGAAGGDRLVVSGLVDVELAAATAAFMGALPGQLELIDI